MGQDIFSGLAMLVSEELNTPLEEVEVVSAPVSSCFWQLFFSWVTANDRGQFEH